MCDMLIFLHWKDAMTLSWADLPLNYQCLHFKKLKFYPFTWSIICIFVGWCGSDAHSLPGKAWDTLDENEQILKKAFKIHIAGRWGEMTGNEQDACLCMHCQSQAFTAAINNLHIHLTVQWCFLSFWSLKAGQWLRWRKTTTSHCIFWNRPGMVNFKKTD